MIQKIDVIDLFCGCGGLSYGFLDPGLGGAFRVLGGLDVDKHACSTYASQIGAPALNVDVKSMLTEGGLKAALSKLHPRGSGPLVVVGGPPCQGFSAHRKKDPRIDERNDLVRTFVEVACALSPEFIIMENVPEIFDDKHWASTNEAIKFLERAGYRVRTRIHSLASFGVPQARFRALLVARRAGRAFNMPEPARMRHRTVRDAIQHLPKLRAGQVLPADPMHAAPNHTARILELIRSIPKDGGSRRSAKLELLPDCHDDVDGFRDVYGRLAWDQPSISITAKCSTPSCGRFLHPEQDRNISVREAALLQGFPHEFVFSGPLVQRYRQVGNAVSPIFAANVASLVLREISNPSVTTLDFDSDIHGPQGRSFTSSIASRKRRPTGTSATRPVALDFFCGAGGLSLGLRRVGFEVRYAFDHDEDAIRTYKYNLGPEAELGEANCIEPRRLLSKLQLRPGDLDLLAGGPPCQGFSQHRRGQDLDSRNDLVIWYASAIEAMLPKAFLLENVPYIAAKRGRSILDRFLSITANAGYAVTTATINASDFGVPQNRPRFVAIGFRGGSKLSLATILQQHSGPETVWSAIGHLPSPPPHESGEHPEFANHVGSKISELNRRRISYVPQGGGWKNIPPRLRLACHQNHKGHGHLDVFGRLSWTGIAQTITAHSDSFTRGRYAHPVENRPLTGRELAALQSFPHWFRFMADKKSVARLVGNAIPPPLAEALGRIIFSELQSLPRIPELMPSDKRRVA